MNFAPPNLVYSKNSGSVQAIMKPPKLRLGKFSDLIRLLCLCIVNILYDLYTITTVGVLYQKEKGHI